MPKEFQSVKKRDGRIVPFDQNRIVSALYRAMQAASEGNFEQDAMNTSQHVIKQLINKFSVDSYVPSIEEIQDVVEETLIVNDFPKTAKAYILYRSKRANIREQQKPVSPKVHQLVQDSKKYFSNSLSEFIYYRTYSRWLESEHRRETWIETVDRYMQFMKQNLGDKLSTAEYEEIHSAILHQQVMPSMRLMWSAGHAAAKTNVCGYNCSYIAPSKLKDFSEIVYILMCGTGVGFSVESQNVQRLPLVKKQKESAIASIHTAEDSKEGWADALFAGLTAWYNGQDIEFDYSKIRPAGARLMTMGGRSSGPAPLKALLDFARSKVLSRQGRRLSNIDVHDIICKIGEIVVMGGVRRSSLISLSDFDDLEMRYAKDGQFYYKHPERQLANNSVAYSEKPTAKQFLEEWISLSKSGSGERGIFNRGSLKDQLPTRRWPIFKMDAATSGTNPCGEIILKSKQFCNLTEIVARHYDTLETLNNKARIATILGTYQATLTNFKYLSDEWQQNCEEERLLGVSITGQWDCDLVRDKDILDAMLQTALATNKKYAKRFDINESTCITCVKPSGTVSQLVNASSGMHPRHSAYYIRRVRISSTDPLFQMLKDQKFPYHPEIGQLEGSASTYVLEFPVKSPKSLYRNDLTAIQQLEHWQLVKKSFTEHNPSVTISVGEDEWIEVANWLYKNWNILGGLSFLPREDHVYTLAPYEEIDEEKYNELEQKIPAIDFASLVIYEEEDQTSGAQELACVSGACDLVL